MRRIQWAIGLSVATLVLGASIFTAQRGLYGWTALLRRGGSLWVAGEPNDPRLSPASRAALAGARPEPGEPVWTERAPGFETADMEVRLGEARDRMRLLRIDPTTWRFVVRASSAGDKGPEEWRAQLGAAAVVNGSYFDRRGAPDTPLVADGERAGPQDYAATHGAFVADAQGARLVDLKLVDWRAALAGARDGFVSYPMLIGEDGAGRVSPSRWLAARSFVGEDRAGRILIGTTEDAGLTLETFGDLLRRAPLDLKLALNLDGGPLACQAVAIGGFARSHCGQGEAQVNGESISILRPGFDGRGWGLPIVLAVLPK
jgi:hypothetical protein